MFGEGGRRRAVFKEVEPVAVVTEALSCFFVGGGEDGARGGDKVGPRLVRVIF